MAVARVYQTWRAGLWGWGMASLVGLAIVGCNTAPADVVVESGVLIFGLSYLVANAWWIARSLLLPPMKFEM